MELPSTLLLSRVPIRYPSTLRTFCRSMLRVMLLLELLSLALLFVGNGVPLDAFVAAVHGHATLLAWKLLKLHSKTTHVQDQLAQNINVSHSADWQKPSGQGHTCYKDGLCPADTRTLAEVEYA